MKNLGALAAGALFGAGLVVSGMTDPSRVLAFLDVAGAWDPSLALVMGGALLPSSLAYRWVRRRQWAMNGNRIHLPTRVDIDLQLVLGAALFGAGWGLAGVCPGPAVALLSTADPTLLLFIAAMLAGMALHALTKRK